MFPLKKISRQLFHINCGESYASLLRYMVPEIITSLLIFSALTLVDAKLIADLGSHNVYASLGVGTTVFHVLVKIGESFMAATVILGGRFNGKKQFVAAGQTFINSFWVTVFLGLLLTMLIYFIAPWFYKAHHFSSDIVDLGTSYLRLKAISIFLMFIYLSAAGFFKSIKNNKLPMQVFGIGAIFFIAFDCILIEGLFGFKQLGLIGSAIASIIQYGIMVALVFAYLLIKHTNSKYNLRFFLLPSVSEVKTIFNLTWPVLIDKATLGFAFVWLGLMIAKTGDTSLASFTVIRDLMALVCIPAQAAAHILSFLTSNAAGRSHWTLILINAQKLIWLTIAIVGVVFLWILNSAENVVGFFDPNNKFSDLAIWALFPLSILVLGDILQLAMSGVMRGVGRVNYVMWVRCLAIFGYFVPFSYMVLKLPIEDNATKFLMIYLVFYSSFFLMAACYMWLFKYAGWRLHELDYSSS